MDQQIPIKPSIRNSRTIRHVLPDNPHIILPTENLHAWFPLIKIGLLIAGVIIALIGIIALASFILNNLPAELIAAALLVGTVFFLIKVCC